VGVQSYNYARLARFKTQKSTEAVDSVSISSATILNILSVALGIGIVVAIALHANSNRLLPESEMSVNSSEYYVFTSEEVLDFWNRNLGTQFSQEDRFIGSLFPSISEEAKLYSAPYLQLMFYPTAEALELDRMNFESDVESLGNGWVACSNVALVFPLSRQKELDRANDVFCK
jgi:hypothetical protein